MRRAIDLARQCVPTQRAYSVGAVIVAADGSELAAGYSREAGSHQHAEESALAKLMPDDPRLPGATLYTTLEPCSARQSHTKTCTELVIAAGVKRVVLAWREPPLFVDCMGVELLTSAGVAVVEVPEVENAARAVNAHLVDERDVPRRGS